MNKKNSDQLFSELLLKDRAGEPDKAIENRLMYSFLLKSSNTILHQNSFASFAGWLFSAHGLGLKTGLVSVVLFFSLMNNQLTFDSGKVFGNDTITNERILLADSAHFIQTVDSIRRDSLY